jgi:hypothetical protein
MSCFVSNVSARETTARIEVIGFTGAVIHDTGEFTLAPGETNGASATENARCKFTVRSKNAIRAHGTVNHAGIGSTSSVEAR